MGAGGSVSAKGGATVPVSATGNALKSNHGGVRSRVAQDGTRAAAQVGRVCLSTHELVAFYQHMDSTPRAVEEACRVEWSGAYCKLPLSKDDQREEERKNHFKPVMGDYRPSGPPSPTSVTGLPR